MISQTFINEQIALHLAKSELLRELKLDLDSEDDKMLLKGVLQLPLDDMREMGIDPSIARFRFQLTVKPRVSRMGALILEFPVAETFFYQANSKNPQRDKVIIPVQLLSFGLASAKGYLSALSGDFSTFDRKAAKLKALISAMRRTIAEEKNVDALEALKNEKRSLELQLEANELQRAQFQRTSKTLTNLFGGGEEEFDLNNQVRAHNNALILRMKLEKIVPYLKDVHLGGVRVSHNRRDGGGENYFVIDVNSKLLEVSPPVERAPRKPRSGLAVAPAVQIRMNQDIFRSKMVIETQKEKLGEDVKDFAISFKEDGVHVTGKVKKWIFTIPFDSIVDFVSTDPNVFEVRLRELRVLGMSLKFLTEHALNAVKEKLDSVLVGICKYEYLGDKDGSKVLRVQVEPKNLAPAFPDLHLVDVDVRDRSFTLRIGKVLKEVAP